MIPQKIHFCWFSSEPYPEKILRCLKSWKRVLPDYEQIRWTKEKALALNIPWVNKAIKEKRWAFAADAVRLYAIWNEGGIYLDTDVECIRPFTPLLNQEYFFCYENGSKRIEGAVLGAQEKNPFIKQALDFYLNTEFNFSEENIDQFILPKVMQNAFEKFSLNIFPEEYFSPKNYYDGTIQITENTFCIHHFESSWRSPIIQKSIKRRHKLYQIFPKPVAKILNYPISLFANLKTLGVKNSIKKLFH